MTSLDQGSLGDLVALQQAADAAETISELASRLEDAARIFGHRWFALVRGRHVREDAQRSFLLTNYPDGWIEQVLGEGRHLDDPVHLAASRSFHGVAWDEIGQYVEPTARQLETLQAASTYGLRHGMTIPFRMTGLMPGMFSLAGQERLDLSTGSRLLVYLLGSISFARAHELSVGRTKFGGPPLSPRQIDCVALVAEGLNDCEIARRLSLSPNTVREYIEAARRRYGVKRRIQLVIAAIRDGYLDIDAINPSNLDAWAIELSGNARN